MTEESWNTERKTLPPDYAKTEQRSFLEYKLAPVYEPTSVSISIGEKVLKYTGDYQIEGTVVGIFSMLNGAVRYVVEHEAKPHGSFCHIYSVKNIKRIE